MRPTSPETVRQIVHVAMGGFALLLRTLTWPQAAALACAALAFNLFVLPRIGGRLLYRPADAARGYPLGIVLYPLAVLLLILVFPERPDIVAAAWAMLAVGDGCATLAGRWIGGGSLPWNREKTLAGTITFAVAGGLAGVGLAAWTAPAVTPRPDPQFLLWAPVAAALTLWCASLMTRDAWAASSGDVARLLVPAVALNALVAWLGWRAGTVTTAGATTGALIGIAVFAGAGWQGWTLLFAAFFAATITSRLGLARKAILGIAESRGGRRGAGNALANTGVAALAAVLAVATPYRIDALVALAAALVAGASDTVASEIGKAWGRRTVLVTTLSRVARGTSGAVSLEGTAAGLGAAAGLAALAAGLGLTSAAIVPIVVVAATLSSVLESTLGATLEGPGILNNDLLNFLNTASAAAAALILMRLLP